ncbi:MAG: hypothetical protein ABSC15_06685 [Terriglobales bacterium]|jgi:hypothetical protein
MTRTGNYDLAVAYRIYPKVSGPALDLGFGDDKYSLSEVCLKSFKGSLGSLRVKMWAILDGCPSEYEALFCKYFDDSQLVVLKLDGVGNHRTFAKQIEVLLGQSEADLVYFAEDDYFYLPDQFSSMIEFLRADPEVDFVSPFDHLDCYRLALHRTPKWIKTSAGRHWRTASSTCLTFLTRKETLSHYRAVFESYVRGNFDSSLWLSLTKQRVGNPFFLIRSLLGGSFEWKIIVKAWLYCWLQIVFGKRLKLWVPVPGIATHLDAHSLSPGVDWQRLMSQSFEGACGPRDLYGSRR